MNQYEELQSLIFNGTFEQSVQIEDYTFIIGTLYAEDEEEFTFYNTDDKIENFVFVINVLSKSIRRVNGISLPKDGVYEVLLGFPSQLIYILYKHYKEILDKALSLVSDNFSKFIETNESRMRWVLFKNGYRFREKLTKLQEHWIYYNYQVDKKEDFDQKYNLAQYIVNHITHAVINPKSYVRFVKNNKPSHQNDAKQFSEADSVDLNKKVFDELKVKEGETKEEANKRVNGFLQTHLLEKDDHDKMVDNQEVERLKLLLRKRKLSKQKRVKPSVVINKKIGQKHEIFLDSKENVNEDLVQNPFFVNNVDYRDIVNQKAFFDIENKEEILQQVINEDSQLLDLENKPILKEDEIEQESPNIPEVPKKTLRELLNEKGLQLDKNIKLNELEG